MTAFPVGSKVRALRAKHQQVGTVEEEPRGLFVRVRWPDGSMEHFNANEVEAQQ